MTSVEKAAAARAVATGSGTGKGGREEGAALTPATCLPTAGDTGEARAAQGGAAQGARLRSRGSATQGRAPCTQAGRPSATDMEL